MLNSNTRNQLNMCKQMTDFKLDRNTRTDLLMINMNT